MTLNTITTPTTRRRYADDCIIVSLDIRIDEVNLAQLSQLGLSMEPFTDQNECINFITRLKDEKVFCLISDQLVEHNILFLHRSPLVTSIYVICTNGPNHEHWTKDYPKIKGVSGDLLPITQALKRDVQLVYRNSTPVSVLAPASSLEPTNTLNAMFMYCELLKETFLEMNHGEKAKRALVDYCKCEYADNEAVLRVIDEFDREYAKHSPTWWYTRDCFVYRMLNKALRTHDLEVIIKFGFFIKDLHRQLEDLYETLPSGKFTVYRGQSMSIEEFVKLKQNVGGLISFNSFLSTSADEHVSLVFALSSLDDPSLKAIFYVINVDLALISSPVGYLDGRLSYFYEEQEYLWGMDAIFRISEIRELENGVCQVNLTMTSVGDPQLKQLTDYMRREVGILSGMQRLGNLMIEMGEWKKAKDIYETLLQDEEDPCIIQQLGFIAHRMDDLDAALRHYRHALSVFATLLSPNDPELATIYSNVGCVLNDKGHLEEALEQFKRTLELQRSVEKPNKLYIARTYNNIATVHDKQGRQKEALENMGHALRMLRECLPSTHPEIAASLGNIGTFYYKHEQYSKAINCYEKCLSIQEASLPSHHPDIVHTTSLMKQTFARIEFCDKVLKKSFSDKVTATLHTLRNCGRRNLCTGQRNKYLRSLAWGLACLVLITVVAILYLRFHKKIPGSPQPFNSTVSTPFNKPGTSPTMASSSIRSARRALLLTDDSYEDAPNILVNYMNANNVELIVMQNGAENYTGFPDAKLFDVIILFPRRETAADMPVAGQQAILNAQQAGIGVVLTEWSTQRVHQQNQWHILASLCLMFPSDDDACVPHITFTNLMEHHPIWNALPPTFTSVMPICGSANYMHGSDAMLVAKCETCGGGQLGVVVQDQSHQGKGRIVQINHAINALDYSWVRDRNVIQLMVNSVNWAAKST